MQYSSHFSAFYSGMRCGIKYQPPRWAYIKAAAGVSSLFIDSCALLIDSLFEPRRVSISVNLIQGCAHSMCVINYQSGRKSHHSYF